jgi:autotransporter-associated beta strand protein/YVTN family beta-propeller protein
MRTKNTQLNYFVDFVCRAIRRQSPATWPVVLVALAIEIAVSSGALGGAYTWQVQAGDWSVASNWGSVLPSSTADIAYVLNGGTVNVTQTGESCGTLSLGGSGSVNLTAGSLAALYENVPAAGSASFTQSGGTNSFGTPTVIANLYVGGPAGSSGTYSLSGSGVLAAGNSASTSSGGWEYVGYSGHGTFTQNGGTNSMVDINSSLNLGWNTGAVGVYNLNDGLLSCGANEWLSFTGSGTFNQTGGTHTVANTMQFAQGGGSGTYNLSGGSLYATYMELGINGSGTFTQSGGSASFSRIYLGYNSGSGTYNLNAGRVTATTFELVGNIGKGTFNQTAGTNAAGSLELGGNSGVYNLSGGLLVLTSLYGSQTFAFNFNGGVLQAGGSFSTSVPMTLGTSGGGATFDTAGYVVTLVGPLSGAGRLTKVDSGTLILAASNGYAGITTIAAGTLSLANAAALPGSIAFAGGSLQYSASNSRDYSGRIVNSSGAITIDTNGQNVTFASAIVASNTGGLTKLGSGILTLASNNGFSGNTLISGGSLALTNSLALKLSTLDSSGNGALSFASLTDATFAGLTGPGTLTLSNSASSAVGLSVGDTNASATFSGTLQGPGSLAKIGSGTLLMAGNNTYSGTTAVNQGELVVNGSLVSPVTVNSGGILGGTGSLSFVTVNAGGQLSPGDAPGIMTLSGNLTLMGSAVMDYQLDTPLDSDMVLMTSGALTLNGQQFSDFNFTSLGGFGPGAYSLIDAGSISGSLGSGTSGTIDGYQASLAVQGNNLVLNVVPEPGTLALLAAGVIGLLGYSWRRQQCPAHSTRNSSATAGTASCRLRRTTRLLHGLLFATLCSSPAEVRALAPTGTLLKSFPIYSNELVVDPSQPYIYASVAASDAIEVLNTQTLSVQSTITLRGQPKGMALSPDGKSLYVADSTNNSIDVINTQTLSLSRSLSLATTPYSIAAGPSNRLYVLDASSVYNHIDQIDAITGASTGPSYGFALYYGDLETSPDGRTLYYGQEGLSPSTLSSFDISTTTITPLNGVQTGSNGEKVVVSHNGATIAQPNGAPYAVTLYSSSGFTALGSFSTGPYPDAFAFSADDRLAYVALSPYPTAVDIYSTTSFAQIGQFGVPDRASCMVTDPTGQELFVSCDGTYWHNSVTAVYSTGVSVPEPASIALALTCGLCLLGYRWRRRPA